MNIYPTEPFKGDQNPEYIQSGGDHTEYIPKELDQLDTVVCMVPLGELKVSCKGPFSAIKSILSLMFDINKIEIKNYG